MKVTEINKLARIIGSLESWQHSSQYKGDMSVINEAKHKLMLVLSKLNEE